MAQDALGQDPELRLRVAQLIPGIAGCQRNRAPLRCVVEVPSDGAVPLQISGAFEEGGATFGLDGGPGGFPSQGSADDPSDVPIGVPYTGTLYAGRSLYEVLGAAAGAYTVELDTTGAPVPLQLRTDACTVTIQPGERGSCPATPDGDGRFTFNVREPNLGIAETSYVLTVTP